MAAENVTVKTDGIACPACGAVENYKGRTNKPKPNNSIERTKECENCKTVFATIEVPIGIVDVKRRTRKE